MAVRPDRRLACLALAELAGIGALWGSFMGVLMSIDQGTAWPVLWVPAMLAVMGGGTLGVVLALVWWACAGQVTYSGADGVLTGSQGPWVRKQIPVERIADIGFDRHVRWTHLVFTHWFTYDSPIPALPVTLTRTPDRWDPTNAAVVNLPRIPLSGERQRAALLELRQALGLPADDRVGATAPSG